MPASVEEIEEAESEGIVVNPGWGPKEVLVDDNRRSTRNRFKEMFICKRCRWQIQSTVRCEPALTVECKHLFFSVGQSIVWGDLLKGK